MIKTKCQCQLPKAKHKYLNHVIACNCGKLYRCTMSEGLQIRTRWPIWKSITLNTQPEPQHTDPDTIINNLLADAYITTQLDVRHLNRIIDIIDNS